jgi:hypothetical protein
MKLPFDLKDIKPGQFAYLTKRKLVNKEKEETGEIFVWKEKEKEESQYVMKCPFCGVEQDGSVLLVKRPYRLRCSSCESSITLPKLQKEAKKR